MANKPPLCVVINGPSAAGKSTLAAAIQDHAEEPLLRFGVDELYRMVPGQWAGGVANAHHADRGFTYQDVTSVPGARRINNGTDAIAMLHAMNSAILGILGSGVGVVVDGQAFEPSVNVDLENSLRDLQARELARVAIIELAVADEPLADRQRRHPHPVGLSLHQNSLPKQAASATWSLRRPTCRLSRWRSLSATGLTRSFGQKVLRSLTERLGAQPCLSAGASRVRLGSRSRSRMSPDHVSRRPPPPWALTSQSRRAKAVEPSSATISVPNSASVCPRQ